MGLPEFAKETGTGGLFALFAKNKQAAPNYGEFLTPDAQQYYQENMGALAAQKKIVPASIQAEKEMLPGLQEYQKYLYGSQVGNLMDIYGGIQDTSIERQGQYGGQLLGMYGQMGAGATEAAVGSLSPWAQQGYNAYGQQAASDVALGSSLNAQETDQAQQAARAAAQARGLNFSRQGSDLEVLNTYNMGQKRLEQRRTAFTNAYGMAKDQQGYGAQAYLAPAMQTSSVYSTPSIFGAAQGSFEQMGSQFLQPESQYLANIRANRIQQENADKAASAQRAAGNAGAMGAIAGAAIVAI
jgi:hypothetical protein